MHIHVYIYVYLYIHAHTHIYRVTIVGHSVKLQDAFIDVHFKVQDTKKCFFTHHSIQ